MPGIFDQIKCQEISFLEFTVPQLRRDAPSHVFIRTPQHTGHPHPVLVPVNLRGSLLITKARLPTRLETRLLSGYVSFMIGSAGVLWQGLRLDARENQTSLCSVRVALHVALKSPMCLSPIPGHSMLHVQR